MIVLRYKAKKKIKCARKRAFDDMASVLAEKEPQFSFPASSLCGSIKQNLKGFDNKFIYTQLTNRIK